MTGKMNDPILATHQGGDRRGRRRANFPIDGVAGAADQIDDRSCLVDGTVQGRKIGWGAWDRDRPPRGRSVGWWSSHRRGNVHHGVGESARRGSPAAWHDHPRLILQKLPGVAAAKRSSISTRCAIVVADQFQCEAEKAVRTGFARGWCARGRWSARPRPG